MHLSIFDDSSFSLESMTAAINDLPVVPGRLGELGWFKEQGMTTTSLSLERMAGSLTLVPSAPRGAPGKPYASPLRKAIALQAVHLPQSGAVLADEVQNLRAFGKETEVDTVMNVVRTKLARMKSDIDATLEFQRMGALKGQVLDADGTVLHDMFDAFDVPQTTHTIALGTATTPVLGEIVKAKRKAEASLAGKRVTGWRVLASPGFFDALVAHKAVTEAYARWQDGEFLRTDYHLSGFGFGGVLWEELNVQVGGTKFVEDNVAYLVPEGVDGMFRTYFAPGDYVSTVNTFGLPYYAMQEPMGLGKGVLLDAQSNPLHINTLPAAIVKLTLT